ncbi:tRNA N6-adenosine threonylcarbamoyltransferase [bioreactor metagenome]|uniref:tRNA N6-adenosine threonylcarbamoyltransferase n=1 Tax=bioreactor metagenome TaxID=1076179 RepID=A0A645BQC0_9ZZZZ
MGGVAANSRIRADLENACRQAGDRLCLPPLSLCGDNAAMIGCQAYYEYRAGRRGDLFLNAYANRDITLG